MSYLNFQKQIVTFQPTSYTANEVQAVMNVEAGDLIGLIIVRNLIAYDGSGTDAIVELGDGDDNDRFMDGGEVDETSTTSWVRAIGATGGGYILYRTHLYTAQDTIDVNFTANTSGSRTVGRTEFTIYKARVRP